MNGRAVGDRVTHVSGVYRMELSILVIEQAYLNIQMELVL